MESSEKGESIREKNGLPRIFGLYLTSEELGLVMLMQNVFGAFRSRNQQELIKALEICIYLDKSDTDIHEIYMSIGNKIAKLMGEEEFGKEVINKMELFKKG